MAKKRSRRSVAVRKPARSHSAAPHGLARLSVADLQAEIRRRQRGVKTLHRRRAKLVAKIEALDAQIVDRAGKIAAEAGLVMGRVSGRVRPKNDTNLIDALRAALKGKTMGVSEAAEAVQEAGYKSSSPNFRTIVNATLLKKQHFKKVERGQYTAA